MKEYNIKRIDISNIAPSIIGEHLNSMAKTGWIFKQVIINESTDEYIIIMEKEF